jgi:hypothetical protein
MGCGCGKSKEHARAIVAGSVIDSIDVDEWGPAYWHILHCLAHRIGGLDDPVNCTDQARALEYLIAHLGYVIPCNECQSHALEYFRSNRLTLVGLQGAFLRNTAELWLLNFHNSVRLRNNQPIMVSTIAELAPIYDNCTIIMCTEDTLARSAKYAIDHGIVKAPAWKRWTTEYRKLKLSVGA